MTYIKMTKICAEIYPELICGKIFESEIITNKLETLLSAMIWIFMTSRMLTTRARTLQTKKTKTTTISIVASPISFFCRRVKRARSELARRTFKKKGRTFKMKCGMSVFCQIWFIYIIVTGLSPVS